MTQKRSQWVYSRKSPTSWKKTWKKQPFLIWIFLCLVTWKNTSSHLALSLTRETVWALDIIEDAQKMIVKFHNHFFRVCCVPGEGNGNPLKYSCLETPTDRGAWWAAVHGVAESRTQLSDFTFTFPFHALEKEMATHSSVLAWRIPGSGEPGGLPSMGSHRVRHDWSNLAAAVLFFGNGTSKFYRTLLLLLFSKG